MKTEGYETTWVRDADIVNGLPSFTDTEYQNGAGAAGKETERPAEIISMVFQVYTES